MTDAPPVELTFHSATPEMLDFMAALQATLVGRPIPQMHALAIAAQFVGRLVALQDVETCTADMALAVVAKNIETGNQQVVDAVLAERRARDAGGSITDEAQAWCGLSEPPPRTDS